MPLPVVNQRDLRLARLSAKLRRTLAHRAKQAARREYAPILAADKQAFGAANAAYRTEAQSVRGATSMVQNSLAQALQSLQGSGLRGGYLKQARNELLSRQGDAAASIPFLLADAASNRATAIQDARTQLISDRAQMQSSAASGFNALLKESRGQASSVLKARADDLKPSESESKSLTNAAIALRNEITAWKRDPGLRELNPLSSQADWLRLARGLDSEYQGFGLADAMKVINAMRRRWEKHPEKAATGLRFRAATTTR